MKIEFERERYNRLLFLGFEFWRPDESHWIKFSARLMVGPYIFSVNVGSKERYNKLTKQLRGE
jgi:hypothetical protein